MDKSNGGKSQDFIIDIPEIINELIGRIVWIILAAVVFAAAAGAYEKFAHTPKYTATTSLYVLAKNNEKTDLTTSDLQAGSLLTKDYEEIIKSRTVAYSVIEQCELKTDGEDMSYADFRKKISVRVPDDTRIIYISVTDPDPKLAKTIADAVSAEAAKTIMDVMSVENVKTLDAALVPLEPSNINVKKMIVLGGAAGFVIACIVILFLYFSNDTVKGEEDIERLFGISVLGTIPMCKNLEDDRVRPIRTKKKKLFSFGKKKARA